MNRENQSILALGEAWARELGKVLEGMTGERPDFEAAPGALPPDAGLLWWKQFLDSSPGSAVWIGVSPEACSALGQSILSGAGIDSSDADEQKNSFFEVVRQSLAGFAGVAGAQIGRDVACGDGSEEEPPSAAIAVCEIRLNRPAGALSPLYFVANRELMECLSPAAAADQNEALVPATELSTRAYSTLNLLMDVELPVSVSFGRTRIRMQEILNLMSGSVIELDRAIAEPVSVLVNNCVVARGEVVVVDGNYGVRINEVMSRTERLHESRRYLQNQNSLA